MMKTYKIYDTISMSDDVQTQEAFVSAKESDGRIVLNFLDDDMEVRGDFFPAGKDGSQITQDYITAFLIENNVVHGVNYEEINNAYTVCVHHREIVRDVLVARGTAPVNEVLEYMQLNPYLGQNSKYEKEDGSVDFRARSPFIIVRKDQVLAKHRPRKPGKDGVNVKGAPVPCKVIKPDGVSAGPNTRMEGENLLSNISGQMLSSKGIVSVSESLHIKGSVGYNTGNINFPGDVEIEGTVSDGFKIISGGSVTIKQTFDVTEAVIKKDLNVVGGIIGRGQSMVKVGGDLKTKFIENCRVACRKTVGVETEIINSNIYTLETLEMGDKGKIVGGEIYALKGVRAGSIGRKTARSPRIHCGIDFTIEQEKEKNNSIMKVIASKLNRLRQLMEDPSTDAGKKEKMEALMRHLEEEQQKAQARLSELLGKTNNYMDAAVEVLGEVSEGALIEICQVALFVTTPLKKVRIRLDKATGKLITEKL